MIGPYPDEPAGDFAAPPTAFEDDEGRRIEVTRRDPDDEAEFESIVDMYDDFEPADRAQGIPPVGEDAVRSWLEAIEVDDAIGVVAWHDEEPVGHAILVPADDDTYELAIFVSHDYQGARIGTRLLRALFGHAQERDIETVWLTVERWNDPAIRLYHKVGFQEVDSESFEVEMTVRL